MTSTNKPATILLSSTARTPFIDDDIELLRRHFDVQTRFGHGVGETIGLFFEAMRADIAISWFGSVYSWFMVAGARVARKPSMIILGGVDTAKDSEHGYGVWRTPWKAALLRHALKHASRVVAVDSSLIEALRKSSGWPAESVTVLPTGYDPGFWQAGGVNESLVLCVASCDSDVRMHVKGIDVLIESARRLPGVHFTIIGIAESQMRSISSLPTNVEILPPLPRAKLLPWYQRAAVYCQPSRREGLPNTLCEAMLCECIPVGSDAGGIPSAIGESGFVVPREDSEALASAISLALSSQRSGRAARQRVINLFSRKEREVKLVRMIGELLDA